VVEVISDKLIARVKERFPHAKAIFGAPPKPSVVFPALHPEVGDIEIYDDGSELTLIAGHFTHSHFSDYDNKSNDESEQAIVNDLIAFLERLFTNQVILWGSHNSGGGWYNRDGTDCKNPELESMKQVKQLYVWSGPLRGGAADSEDAQSARPEAPERNIGGFAIIGQGPKA